MKGSEGLPMLVDVHLASSLESKSPLVIYAHGINGFKDWGGMNLIAQKFAQAGFIFLKFNFSHNGTTPAQPEEFANLEAYKEDSYLKRQFDLNCILNFVLSEQSDFQFDESRLSLIGHSRGGPDVLLFAANEVRINRVITWAAVAHCQTPWQNLEADAVQKWSKKGYYTRENGRTGQQMPIGYSLFEEYQAHKERLNLEKAARSLSIPWLIVHGDADEAVFVKSAYDLKAWRDDASVFIIENTGHTFDRTHPWAARELPDASLKKVNRSIEFLQEAE